jgi:hypothetical protein
MSHMLTDIVFYLLTFVSGVLLGRTWGECYRVQDERSGFDRGRFSREAEVETLREMLTISQEERARLIQRLADHRVRVERHEAGLPEIEVTRDPRQRNPMSEELREYIAGFRSSASREALMGRANALLHEMKSSEVLEKFQREQEV